MTHMICVYVVYIVIQLWYSSSVDSSNKWFSRLLFCLRQRLQYSFLHCELMNVSKTDESRKLFQVQVSSEKNTAYNNVTLLFKCFSFHSHFCSVALSIVLYHVYGWKVKDVTLLNGVFISLGFIPTFNSNCDSRKRIMTFELSQDIILCITHSIE